MSKHFVILLVTSIVFNVIHIHAQLSKLPAKMILPQVIQTKDKNYILNQANTEAFLKQFNLTLAETADTLVVVYEFNQLTANTKKLAGLGFARSGFACCYFNGKIYIAGGFNLVGSATNTLYEFDIATKKINIKKPMLQPRVNFVLETIAGKMYAISGNETLCTEWYNIEKNTWEAIPVSGTKCMPSVTASGIIEDKAYLIGPNGEFQIFSPALKTIIDGVKAPFILINFDAVVYNKRLYVAGGETATETDHSVFMFNLADGSWSNVGKMPSDRSCAGLVYYNGMLLLMGGSITCSAQNTQPTNEIYIYRPSK